MTALFVCAIEENTMIMCERHAKVFEQMAIVAKIPHTIIELEEEDRAGHVCHACNLEDELASPKIILPH
jgi:hypothetical protein